jgi:transcriptional regulator with XRE-family HTH domain
MKIYTTAAAQVIAAYIQKHGLTPSELAQKIGVTPAAIYHYLTGFRVPDVKRTLRLESLSKRELSRKKLRPDIYSV